MRITFQIKIDKKKKQFFGILYVFFLLFFKSKHKRAKEKENKQKYKKEKEDRNFAVKQDMHKAQQTIYTTHGTHKKSK